MGRRDESLFHMVERAYININQIDDSDLPLEAEDMGVKREIPQGGIILEEKPFVFILCSKFRTERCDFCFKKDQLSKCSVCRNTYYCGRACQREGWSIHKLECQYIKEIAPRVLPDAARMLARLIKVIEKGGDSTKGYYTDKKYRTFKDLMSHYPNLKNDQPRMEHFSSLYGVLYEFFRGECMPNSAELMGMYGRMCVNSFSICNQELQSLGTGMYLGASIVDHSCKPTAVVTFEGTTLVMRALETLSNLDWSKERKRCGFDYRSIARYQLMTRPASGNIDTVSFFPACDSTVVESSTARQTQRFNLINSIFISYIDVMATKRERQAELEQTYYFQCRCPKCIVSEPIIEMTGAACPNSNCDNCIDSISMQPGDKCSKCGSLITEEFIKTFKEVVDMTCMHLDSMKETTYLDVCKVCLKKQKGVLYKYNVKHIKTMDLAFDSSIEFGKFDDATEYGLHLIKSFYEYYGKIHPMTGLLHLKLAKLFLYQNHSKEALDNLQKAKEILKITHGLTSSLFKEHIIPLYQDVMLENSL